MRDSAQLLAYLRSRRVLGSVIMIVAVAVTGALWGTVQMSLPAGTQEGSVAMPVWVLLPVPAAAAVVGGLASDLAGLESSGPRRMWPLHVGFLVVGTVLTLGLLAAGLAIGGIGSAIPDAMRNLILWVGIAAVSGRIFGPRLAWVLPLASIFPVSWFGFDYTTNLPLSWAVPMVQFSTGTLLVAFAVLFVGIAAVSLSGWRAARIRHLLSPWQRFR